MQDEGGSRATDIHETPVSTDDHGSASAATMDGTAPKPCLRSVETTVLREDSTGEFRTNQICQDSPNEHSVHHVMEHNEAEVTFAHDITYAQSAQSSERRSTREWTTENTSTMREPDIESCDTNDLARKPSDEETGEPIFGTQHDQGLSLLTSTADEPVARQKRSATTGGLQAAHSQRSNAHPGHPSDFAVFETNPPFEGDAIQQTPMPNPHGSTGQDTSQYSPEPTNRSSGAISQNPGAVGGKECATDPPLVSPVTLESDGDFAALWGSSLSAGDASGGSWEDWNAWLPDIFDLTSFTNLPLSSPTPTEGTRWDR